MISLCILVFGFAQLTVGVQLVPLQRQGRICFYLVKTANAHIFSTVNRK